MIKKNKLEQRNNNRVQIINKLKFKFNCVELIRELLN